MLVDTSILRLVVALTGLSAVGAADCESWCTEPCHILNGNVENECGNCTSDEHLCRPGQPGFSWRERKGTVSVPSIAPTAAAEGSGPATQLRSPATQPSSPATPSLTSTRLATSSLTSSFDDHHGCQPEDVAVGAGGDPCAEWDPDELPERIEPGRRYCVHALCLGRMLAAGGHVTHSRAWGASEGAGYVGAPSHHIGSPYFPLRLAAGELLFALCSQLASTHVLEGAVSHAMARAPLHHIPKRARARRRGRRRRAPLHHIPQACARVGAGGGLCGGARRALTCQDHLLESAPAPQP